MTMIKTNESGRSMIEMLGVLAIIGVLSVGGIAGYSKAMNKFKTNKVADQVSMIIANVKTLYAQQNTYEGLNNAQAVSMGVIPEEMIAVTYDSTTGAATRATDGSLQNSFNGSVFIGAAKSLSTDTDTRAFYIAYNGLSKEACITLATNDWGSGYSSGLIALKVGATDTGNGTNTAAAAKSTAETQTTMDMGCTGSTTDHIACPGGSGLAVPMSVTEAASACSCSDGNKCSILWKYY